MNAQTRAVLTEFCGLAEEYLGLEWDDAIKAYVPCRDERGRFTSCAGGAGTAKPKKKPPGGSKPKKPGAKPAGKPPKEPKKPKEPKPSKPPKEPKKPAAPAKKPPVEKPAKPAAAKPPKEPKKPATAKPAEKPASGADLRSHYNAAIKDLPIDQQKPAMAAFLEKHQTPAALVNTHGMTKPEYMHSIAFDGYNLHYPKGNVDVVLRTARVSELHAPMPAELARHTKNVYVTSQIHGDEVMWNTKYNIPGGTIEATGGDGNVVFYRGAPVTSDYLAHEMGHNMAAARYGMTKPGEFSHFTKATKGEAPPTDYATKSPSEDFAESTMMFVKENARLKKIAPQRHKVLERMLKDPNYVG